MCSSDPAKSSGTLNIVMKLHAVSKKEGGEMTPVVKLSDEKGKYTGQPEAVKEALIVFGIVDEGVSTKA